MNGTSRAFEDLTLTITEEIYVRASLDVTFASLLEELGPENQTPDGRPMPMIIEARPGGRWYRDLGGEDGHFWGHIQAIKRPTLLEITGPLFMSSPVLSNVQYRLSETVGRTLIQFRHTCFGLIPEDQRDGMYAGWNHIHARLRTKAETGRTPQ